MPTQALSNRDAFTIAAILCAIASIGIGGAGWIDIIAGDRGWSIAHEQSPARQPGRAY
jgi:hypothetical protein